MPLFFPFLCFVFCFTVAATFKFPVGYAIDIKVYYLMNGWMDQWVRLHWCCECCQCRVSIIIFITAVRSISSSSITARSQHLSDIISASSQLKHGTDRGFTGEPADIHKFPRDACFIFVPGRPHCRVHPTSDIHGWVHWTQLSVFNIRLTFPQNKPRLSSSHTPELPDNV